MIKTGSADISISADIGHSKIISGSGDITVGNTTDLNAALDRATSRLVGLKRDCPGSGRARVTCRSARSCPLGEVRFRRSRREVPKGAELQAKSRDRVILPSRNERVGGSALGLGLPDIGIADNLAAWLDPQLRIRRHPVSAWNRQPSRSLVTYTTAGALPPPVTSAIYRARLADAPVWESRYGPRRL